MRRLLVVMVIAIAALVALFIFGRTPAPVDALPAGPTLAIDSGIRRLDLRFPCGETKCAGWLYLPTNNTSPGIVVMGHGFAGTRDVALPLFAEKFARSGVAAFVFDYRLVQVEAHRGSSSTPGVSSKTGAPLLRSCEREAMSIQGA
jgi:hypothetical protein